MGLFSRLFRKSKNISSEESEKISFLNEKISHILQNDNYVAGRDYRKLREENKVFVESFKTIDNEKLLNKYCKKKKINKDILSKTIYDFNNIEELVKRHNKAYIENKLVEEKRYLDNILKSVAPKIALDREQREVVLSDEDYTLVIAGAGAGKTTTMAAKVKYLIEKKGINPNEILVISFTNKAVKELKDKINRDLKLEVPISTFHSVGNAILHKNEGELKTIVEPSKLYFVIQKYFKIKVLKDMVMMKNLILFFSSYFEVPDDVQTIEEFLKRLAKSNYTTMKSDLRDYVKEIIDKRTRKHKTISAEIVKSQEEVSIANYLYMHNIDYQYEPIYKYNIKFAYKPYTPDFIIKQGDKRCYIEHFGISQDGHNKRYTQEELEQYKKAINDKIIIHKKHNTDLIYTFSKYRDGRTLLEHLKEELLKRGFVLDEKSKIEVVNKIITQEQNKYIDKLLALITRFIHMFKVNGYEACEFDRMIIKTRNERTKLFLKICKECYFEYQRYLTSNNAIDFDDMINNSSKVLREVKEVGEKLNFKYIIVDEYQDISKQRFDLIKALHEVCDAKIIAVGDDFQSIYTFSGSDISLFTDFSKKFGYADVIRITNTYRNSQELIDIAGNFVEKNKLQIYKELKSPKHLKTPVVINAYKSGNKEMENVAVAVLKALDEIVLSNGMESSVLVLGRFGFDGFKLSTSSEFEFTNMGSKIISRKYPKLNISYMTVHSAKGLGYDNVIVINCKNGTYGFPSQIEDDSVLSLVVKKDRSYRYAEERRLFYVALTRTKNRVYLIVPSGYPSEFLIEILNDYEGIKLNGELNLEVKQNHYYYKKCPKCGYPMQFKYKEAFGLPLYICMNDPEICDFMTNDYKAGKLEVMKCNKCRDGYLIVKKGKDGNYFLGCTNYKKDGTGCDRTISEKEFYQYYGGK